MEYKYSKLALPYRGPTSLNDITLFFNKVIYSLAKINKVVSEDTNSHEMMIKNNHQTIWEGLSLPVLSNIPTQAIIVKDGIITNLTLMGISPGNTNSIISRIDELTKTAEDLFEYEFRHDNMVIKASSLYASWATDNGSKIINPDLDWIIIESIKPCGYFFADIENAGNYQLDFEYKGNTMFVINNTGTEENIFKANIIGKEYWQKYSIVKKINTTGEHSLYIYNNNSGITEIRNINLNYIGA